MLLASITFMQCPASKSLKFFKTVEQVAVFLLRGRSHVIQFPDISLPNPKREDLHSKVPQGCCNGSGVSAVGIAIGDEKYDFGGVLSRVTKDLL